MTMTREPATSPATRTALSATARRAGKHALAQRIPPPALSRVSAWDWMAQLALLPIGYTLAGPLASATGARSTLAIGCLIGIVLLASALSSRSVRELGQDHPAERFPRELAVEVNRPGTAS